MKVGVVLKLYQNLTTFTIAPGLLSCQYVHTIHNEIKNDTVFRQPLFETRCFVIGKTGYFIRAQFSKSEVSSWFTNLGDKYVYDFFSHSYRPDLKPEKIGTLSPFD